MSPAAFQLTAAANACVVDRCLRSPNCCSSELSPTRSRIHDPINDSRILARDSREGDRSQVTDLTALGGCEIFTFKLYCDLETEGSGSLEVIKSDIIR